MKVPNHLTSNIPTALLIFSFLFFQFFSISIKGKANGMGSNGFQGVEIRHFHDVRWNTESKLLAQRLRFLCLHN